MSNFDQENATSYLFGGNAPYIEELYDQFLEDPVSIPAEWQTYFAQLQEQGMLPDRNHYAIQGAFEELARSNSFVRLATGGGSGNPKALQVQALINAYRAYGVRHATLDPLKRHEVPEIAPLNPAYYGLQEADMGAAFSSLDTAFGGTELPLKDILAKLQQTYCTSVGAEFMHISNPDAKKWLQDKLEGAAGQYGLSKDQKVHALQMLTEAEGLERYLHTKYVGQKRFSLEGGESFIVSIDELLHHASTKGVELAVVGMAHRGRLNMLVNVMGKKPADLFSEFEGKYSAPDLTDGDVKYHNGFSSDRMMRGGPMHLSLAFNPSHLEIVNPVVEGSCRARQEALDNGTQTVLPVLVHGDAAFAGQGVVMETLNLSQTRGYGTGGTVHIVINNQIGFTTSDLRDARSTLYATDVAKMIECPVLHVNADDPDAVVFVTRLALEYRMKFNHDVVIDIICFRKLGHNEQDTPQLTQPLMYKSIAKHPGTRKVYADRLVAEGVLEAAAPDQMVKDYRAMMEGGAHTKIELLESTDPRFVINWGPHLSQVYTDNCDTHLPAERLQELGRRITEVPEGFTPHKLVSKLLGDRRKMADGEMPLDWGMGEHLAFASLVDEGYAVRISGQDAGRGTFTHRHAVLHDQNRERWDGGVYIPLQHVSDKQAKFTVIDSVLSEEAVLGFEYGYATANPDSLTIWEAQFGDFANGAQVVIDQFIASGEAKWGRQCGVTMMLPHGYEGQGPEHSSARIERYLQLCAYKNMQVVQPTNAAQIFHLLRRQMLRQLRRPLVIFTPKSLLRNKDATCPMSDFTQGTFQPIIPETNAAIVGSKVKRVLMCSGKVYYDLMHAREDRAREDVAILRVEQLYPVAEEVLAAQLALYPNATEVVWVQDEPQNQGPWSFIQTYLYQALKAGQKLGFAGRGASSSPAVGYASKHAEQQKQLVDDAFAEQLTGVVFTK